MNAIDFYGLRICTCGLINAEGERYSDKVLQSGDSYKRLIFEDNHLVGFRVDKCKRKRGNLYKPD